MYQNILKKGTPLNSLKTEIQKPLRLSGCRSENMRRALCFRLVTFRLIYDEYYQSYLIVSYRYTCLFPNLDLSLVLIYRHHHNRDGELL